MTVRVPANPAVIEWAVDHVKDPMGFKERHPEVLAWINGDRQPTWKQLKGFARRVGIPFGYFFAPHIPVRELPVADFREGFAGQTELSSELWDVLSICEKRQSWYREYVEDLGLSPVPFVGAASELTSDEAAAQMRMVLNYHVENRKGDVAAQRNVLIRNFESFGGLTVFNSMVNDNTSRPLDENEFRGFSLVDQMAPLIFVNSRQTINGQIFTFAHELAHIWRGRGGLGNSTVASDSVDYIEQWCNIVASEFLVPKDDIKHQWEMSIETSFVGKLETLSQRYRCGTLVVLHGLKRAGIVSAVDFAKLYEVELTRLKKLQRQNQKKKSGGGGNILYSRRFRIGGSFSRAVVNEMQAGRLQPTEAMSLTGIKSMAALDKYSSFIQEAD